MGSAKYLATAVATLAVIYQFWFKGYVFDVLGVWRALEPIENFPWDCRRVVHSQLEGCEDLFLNELDRTLYAACSGSVARSQWNPSLSKYNVSGRRAQGAELMAIHIDESTSDGQFRMYPISPQNYEGAAGDSTLDLLGFDVNAEKKDALMFWLINHRPPVDAKKKYVDATKIGSNVSIEVFNYAKGAQQMEHVKTISHPEIHSANMIALTKKGGFVISNDHSSKVGFRKEFDLVLGGGNVVHCQDGQTCSAVTPNSLPFPNGLARGHDGLIYVPFSTATYISVYQINQDGSLDELTKIPVGMTVDNLSVDSKGDIWAVGIPRVLDLIDVVAEPFAKTAPSTILKIRKIGENEYEVIKVLEDGETKVISGATVAVFDHQSGRIFIGGAVTPYLVECKAQKP